MAMAAPARPMSPDNEAKMKCLGNLAACEPWAAVGMQCDACNVSCELEGWLLEMFVAYPRHSARPVKFHLHLAISDGRPSSFNFGYVFDEDFAEVEATPPSIRRAPDPDDGA